MPYFYHVIEAAEILHCSALDLLEHPECTSWMAAAFSYSKGKSSGEYAQKCDVKYWEQYKAAKERIEAAQK